MLRPRIIAERAEVLERFPTELHFERPPWGDKPEVWRFWWYMMPLARPWRARDEIAWLNGMAAEIPLADRPWYQIGAQVEALEHAANVRSYGPCLSPLFAGDLMQTRDRSTADMHTCGIALAAKAYKHDRGAYPENLDQLAQYLHRALPLNPFTGKAYGYERKGQGFAVTVPGQPVGAKGHAGGWTCEK